MLHVHEAAVATPAAAAVATPAAAGASAVGNPNFLLHPRLFESLVLKGISPPRQRMIRSMIHWHSRCHLEPHPQKYSVLLALHVSPLDVLLD